jgi:transcriptional regulator with XRE-family HTH domain
MIKNDRQYKLTRSQLERFRGVLDELHARPSSYPEDARQAFEIEAVEAQVAELEEQIHDYDSLKSGASAVGPLQSLDQLPELLIRARIASGLTQRDLAGRLGLKEQQIQRYEANDWRTAGLSRLIEVARQLGVEVDSSVASAPPETDVDELVQRLKGVGLDSSFLRRRLAPTVSSGDVKDAIPGGGSSALEFAARLGRVFGLSAADILQNRRLRIEAPTALAPSFKLPKRANEPRLRSYTIYSHYLSLVLLQATSTLSSRSIPPSSESFRAELLASKGSLSFETALSFVWDLGIPVLPLADTGGFHAALWHLHDGDIVVLKQSARYQSRWLFDLLHEIRHAMETPSNGERVVIDFDDGFAEGDTEAESSANLFAGDVLLDGRAEPLAQLCVKAARGSVEALKSAVPQVAKREGVRTADLANYMAHRLSMQGINWWGAATNLQQDEADPWAIARDELLARADLDSLSELDRQLLSQALSSIEE